LIEIAELNGSTVPRLAEHVLALIENGLLLEMGKGIS